MTAAEEYAQKYKAATEKLTEAQRARDEVPKIACVILEEWDESSAQPAFTARQHMLAHVTVGGDMQLSMYQCSPKQALGLAEWIYATFGDTKEAWQQDLHHLDCAVWRLSKGECTCGGLKFRKHR